MAKDATTARFLTNHYVVSIINLFFAVSNLGNEIKSTVVITLLNANICLLQLEVQAGVLEEGGDSMLEKKC